MKRKWSKIEAPQAANTAWLKERRRRKQGLPPNLGVQPWRAIRSRREVELRTHRENQGVKNY